MPTFARVTPVLRSFDEAKAREFYVDFLGFTVEFEHRFSDNAPLYIGLSHGSCFIHVSEHYGDASPGAQIRIECDDVNALCKALRAKDYKHGKPGETGDKTPWGTLEITITDPFHNKLTFWQNV